MKSKQGRKQPRILVVGSSNTDLVLSCPQLPQPGHSTVGGEFRRCAGGKGANQAVAAARAGAQVTFVGARGRDDFGRVAAELLRREKIDVRHFVECPKVSSGVALILLGGKSRENMIGVARAANDVLSPKHVHKARAEFKKAKVVVAQLEMPMATVLETAKLAHAANVPLVLNPAPVQMMPKSLLKLVHTLTPNEHEVKLLTKLTDLKKGAEKLLKGGCKHVIVTLGAKGALLVNAAGTKLFPAPKVKPVDTVGAGDCFSGWLAVGIAEGLPIEASIKRALRAASLSVTRSGSQASMPYRREV